MKAIINSYHLFTVSLRQSICPKGLHGLAQGSHVDALLLEWTTASTRAGAHQPPQKYLGSHGWADKHSCMCAARKQMGCEISRQIPRAESLWEDMRAAPGSSEDGAAARHTGLECTLYLKDHSGLWLPFVMKHSSVSAYCSFLSCMAKGAFCIGFRPKSRKVTVSLLSSKPYSPNYVLETLFFTFA